MLTVDLALVFGLRLSEVNPSSLSLTHTHANTRTLTLTRSLTPPPMAADVLL